MIRKTQLMVFLLLAVAALTQVAAATTPTDSQEPGSVLVFPLFFRGAVTVNGAVTPITAIEISITPCPVGSTVDSCSSDFAEDVNLRAAWVCAGASSPPTVCAEADFTLEQTPKGTILINPENIGTPCPPLPAPQTPGCIQTVPAPPCSAGYLIVWVVDDSDQPIKFDRLIGDAVFRSTVFSAAAAYNAIPIQAVATLADGALIPGGSSALNFNGTTAYKAVTGRTFASVHFNGTPPAGGPASETFLVLLTLDVLSNSFNNPTKVAFNDFNENELQHSGSTTFTCWGLRDIIQIDPSANTSFGVKGFLESTSATDLPFFPGGKTGPVTLLGLVITEEFVAGAFAGEYFYPFFNDSVGVSTSFVP